MYYLRLTCLSSPAYGWVCTWVAYRVRLVRRACVRAVLSRKLREMGVVYYWQPIGK